MHIKNYTQKMLALGGDVELSIFTSKSQNSVNLLYRELWQAVLGFEKRFSRFLPNSELSKFNRAAGQKQVISTEFKTLLETSLELSFKTDGLYNPFILPALQRAGYVQSAVPGYENDPQDDHTVKAVVGIDKLEIGENWARIPYNTALDMGGLGKGYLADLLGRIVPAEGVQGYWFSLSGDVATEGTDMEGDAMTLAIQDAGNLVGTLDWNVVCPTNFCGTATSGTFKRNLQHEGEEWHHIINPQTGKPAQTDILLATVCADNAVSADVLASCAVILGSQAAPNFLKKHGASAALLQYSQNDDSVQIEHFGKYIRKATRISQKVHHE